jgi:hypothetical protein
LGRKVRFDTQTDSVILHQFGKGWCIGLVTRSNETFRLSHYMRRFEYVDPDDTLRSHATAHGWPVISLR